MSKGVKKVAKIVGIAALGLVTFGVGSLIVGGAALGSAIGGGIAFGAGGFALSFSTLATIGMGALAIGFSPDAPTIEETGANARGEARADPNALGIYAFGRTTVPLILLYERQHSDTVVSNIFFHCWHRILNYGRLWVNGEQISFSGNNATGDWAGVLSWQRADGTQTDALSVTGWGGNSRLLGCAHSSFSWTYSEDSEKLKGGIPRRIDVEVSGALSYDPRKDSSVGGSGSHDLEDPDTWEYDFGNAALVLLRFLIGEYSTDGDLIWGRGAGYDDIDMDSFIAMANVADETVDSKPRYRLGGIHQLDGSFENFVTRWEQETGGKLAKLGGKYRVWLPHDDLTPLTTITEDDVAAGPVHHTLVDDIRGYYNTARGRYVEPNEGYRGFPYPDVEEEDAIADDGSVCPLNLDFSWVQDVEIAQRIARYRVRRSRFQRVWAVPMGWFAQSPTYAPFTVHILNLPETGGDNQLVRVIERKMSMDGSTLLILQQEDESIYDDTIPLGDPHASNTTGDRVDHVSTVRPRYIDGTFIDSLRPNEIDADNTANNGQPPSWLTALIQGGHVDVPSLEAVIDALELINGPLESDADNTAGNPQPPDWLSALILATHINAGSVEAVLDALNLINAPAESGADQTAIRIGGLINPSYEAGNDGWDDGAGGGLPAGWSIVESNARQGDWAAFVTGVGTSSLVNKARIQVEEGDKMLVTCFARRDAGTGGFCVRVVFLDEDGSTVSGANGNQVTSGSYEQSRLVTTVPAGAVSAAVVARTQGGSGNEGYFDGFWAAIIPRDFDYNALDLANGPAEPDADSTGGNYSIADWGPTKQFSPTWQGFSADPLGNLKYAVSEDGRQAKIWTDVDMIGTSNDVDFMITNIPAEIQPSGSGQRVVAVIGSAQRTTLPVPIGARIWEDSSGFGGTLRFELHRADGTSGIVSYVFNAWNNLSDKGLNAGTTIIYPLT